MRHIDEDTITQAVIARHASAADARLREVMTSLVQHLHAFARDARLTEAEWRAGLRFLADCARAEGSGRSELTLLSDTLGLTALITAANRRRPRGCTEATVGAAQHDGAEAMGEPCFVRGQVRFLDGAPVAGAAVRVDGAPPLHTSADGRFLARTTLVAPRAVPHDGPVGRLLHALGRHPWRPAHLHFTIEVPGGERLETQVFRRGDPYLDADAVFGVRRSLVADWVRHEPGRTPDGHASDVAFTTLDFTFVLDNAHQGDQHE